MENQVLNFRIELAGGGNFTGGFSDDAHAIDHAITDDDETLAGGTSPYCIPAGELDLEPYEGMPFESEETAKTFYNSYARRVGFSIRVSTSRRSSKDGAVIKRSFVCAKQGFRYSNKKIAKERENKRPRTVTRVGCKAMLAVKIQESGKWFVSSFVKEHNHQLVPLDQVHCLRSHRQISGPAKTLIDTLQGAGLGGRKIMSALIKEYGGITNVGFTEVDCRNYMSSRINKQRNMEGDMHILIDHLKKMSSESCDFFYAVQKSDDDDEYHSTGNVFWADAKARMNYTYFGDTVTFDTTFRSNRFKLPFAPFIGVNHHGHPILFGCAFLFNESQESYEWLFDSWLAAMSRKMPVSITTDHDVIIRSAVMKVFPETRHRFCKWRIFKYCQEILSHVLIQYPCFEVDFQKCVNLPDSINEFESCWLSLLDRYNLRDNMWLQSIYSDRMQWVPVYLRNSFFAEMSISQLSDTMNSYFDGYLNASTSVNQFFDLYKKALDSRNEKEVKADYDTMNTPPVLTTPSPMEKQASQLYTRKVFARFQEELVGTLNFMATKVEDDYEDFVSFQVAKYGDDHKSLFYVRFNVLEIKTTCSCKMFEFSGLLCRHVLAVFRVINILSLPSRYILKRWTKNAKSSVILDVQHGVSSYLESHTVRYSTLHHQAFKFVDEGASSLETYNVALAALQEARKNVARALTNDRGTRSKTGRDDNESFEEELSEDNMDVKVRELSEEVESGNRKCEVYCAKLFSVLKDIENHKQQLAVKVNSLQLNLKEQN